MSLLIEHWNFHQSYFEAPRKRFHTERYLTERFLTERFLTERYLTECFLTERYLNERFLTEYFLTESFLTECFLTERFLTERFLTECFLTERFLYKTFPATKLSYYKTFLAIKRFLSQNVSRFKTFPYKRYPKICICMITYFNIENSPKISRKIHDIQRKSSELRKRIAGIPKNDKYV